MSAKEDFANLKFKIECSQVVLTRADRTPIVVRGPGEIWQDEEGVLQYKIFADQVGYLGLNAYMSRPRVIGQLIPDQDYFALEAQDYSFPLWTAARVLPSPRGGWYEGLACGHLHELVNVKAVPPNPQFDFVTLRFRGKLDFPCNQGTETIIRVGGQDRHTSSSLNAAFIDDEELRFEVYHEGEHTVVSLQLPAGQLTPVTKSRIQEALQFILGQQLALMVVETTVDGQNLTRLVSPSRGHGRLSPPLKFRSGDTGEHVWRMFANYFRHVHSDVEAGCHPISRHVGGALESTAASLAARVLGLSVAVEGLAGDCFSELVQVSGEFLAELDAIQTAVQGIALTEQSRNRISGSLSAMRAPRNSDILRAFIAKNRLPNELYDSWSGLRHASAHGGGVGGRDIETVLRLNSEVLSLLYSLVLAAINYTGPRTDYCLPGCPSRVWPIREPLALALASPVVPAPVAVPPQGPLAAPAPSEPGPPAPTPTTQPSKNAAPPTRVLQSDS